MLKFLLIETASATCSIATGNENEIISIRENVDSREHAALITVFSDEVMKESKWKFEELNAVVVSAGPGSYTGLRIGVSTAKGICFAAQLPLIAINTLEALANGFANENKLQENICAVFDARRDEVYYGIWNTKCETIIRSRAALLNEEFENTIEKVKGKISFVGDGAKKISDFFPDSKNSFHPEFKTSAKYLLPIALKKFNERDLADVAYFEPNYIKPFYFAETKSR